MFGLKQWCLDRLAGLHRDYLKIGNRSEATATAEGMLNQLIGNILTYGTYGLMGWFILQGYAELDAGVEAIALSGGLYAAAKSIFETIPSFAVARTADRRMAALYQETCGAVAPGDSGQSQARETGIRLDDVSYSFGDRQILSRVRLSIPVGQISVIRGANGMGKSTLLKLILGMLIPDTGVITIHGTP